VLVVEDNPDVAAFACTLLEELSYTTRRAGNATEALAVLASEKGVDVAFSDVVMPEDTTGIGLAAALRSSRPRLAIVLAAGYSEELVKGGVPEGVKTLSKPYNPDELAAALARTLTGAATAQVAA
jgi:CheY-like chemotaxis protein